NRFFIAVPLWNGLYTVTVLNAGSRSNQPPRFPGRFSSKLRLTNIFFAFLACELSASVKSKQTTSIGILQ
ncbi:hypothetical protein, partial [Burkholderia territorii]|uniref:hypothetical protein n=1 Tax=Burkholderia territorii TaxID=1503055 RepID=UPI001E65D1A6